MPPEYALAEPEPPPVIPMPARPASGGRGLLRTIGATALLDEPEPDVSWLVDSLFPAAGVVVLAGDPKSFKTLLALQLAVTVGYAPSEPLYERDFLGRPCDSGSVLFVEEEGSRHKIRERVQMMTAGQGWQPTLAVDFALHEGVRLDERASLEALYRAAERSEPALIVLDPLVMLHSGDENKASDMGRLMRGLVGIAARLSTCIVIVHHVNKPSAERRVSRAAQRLRGSSAFAGATDANLILDRTGDYTAQLHGEFRDAEPVDVYLELDPATLLLRSVDAPVKSAGKIPPDDLLAFVRETGSVGVRAASLRFGVARNTARMALEAEPRLDVARDAKHGDRYFLKEAS